jgi:hypothetical protein
MPTAWNDLSADQQKQLTDATGMPAPVVQALYFHQGYRRFTDWNAFIASLTAPSGSSGSSRRPKNEAVAAFSGRDKAYGLEKPREKHIAGLVGTEHPTIDLINNKLGMGLALQGLHTITDAEAAAYAEWLYVHPRYNPVKAVRDAHEDALGGRTTHGKSAETIKKSCKAAIEYTTQHEKSTVHFELDGIDFGAVVGKRDAGGWGITAAELRYIYRQVLQLQSSRGGAAVDLARIKFYLRGVEVEAPWITEPELWAKYVPRVHRDGPPRLIGLPSPARYNEMKDKATRSGKHHMLSRKNYAKLVTRFGEAFGKKNWKAARLILDEVHPRLIEMRDTTKNYWISAELRKKHFDPILEDVEELRLIL